MTDICQICSKQIAKKEEKVTCDSLCNTSYHSKCIGFNATALKFYRECRNLKYICDECENKPDASLGKTLKMVLSYLCIMDERLNRQGENLLNLNAEVEKINNNNTGNDFSEQLDDTITEIQEKGDSKMPNTDANSNSVVIVKPKNNQHCNDTKIDLSQHIDPKAFNVNNVKNLRNGGVLISCVNNENSKKLYQTAAQKIGDRYDVIIPDIKKPKIKIFDITESFNDSELIDVIKNQNEVLKNSDLKVLKIYENKRLRNYGAIVEIDRHSFQSISIEKKLNIGWNRCRIEELIAVRKCFKCCGFNHKSAECKNRIACLRCGGEHISKDCKSEHCLCINCDSINKRYKTQYDVSHPAWSKKCPIYLKKLQSENAKSDRLL